MSDGYDRLADRMDRAGERAAGNLADHPGRTVAKWLALIIGTMIIVSLIGGFIAFLGGYFDDAKQIVGHQNRKTQTYDVRQNWNSMLTAAQNACQAGNPASGGNGQPQLVEDPAMAYAATYRNIRTNYNRAQDNPYENGIINASNFPKHVPVFPEENRKPIDWCAVSTHLTDMHI